MSLQIKINEGDLKNVHSMLAGIKNAAPRVISRALNKTITGVRTDVVKGIADEITVTQKIIRKDIRLYKADINNLQASVECQGSPLPLGRFSVSQRKQGVSIKIFRRDARKMITGAFLWISKAGYKAVITRTWKIPRKPVDPKITYGALPYQYRYPIRELFGPRTSDIFSNESVLDPAEKKAQERLDKNLANQLDWELSKI